MSPIRQAYMVDYAKQNAAVILPYKRQWSIENRAQTNTNKRAKLSADITVKLAHSLRTRLNRALKGALKAGSAIKLLGCTIEFLKEYLEKQFQPGMTWDNHTRFGWHIDHIIPLSEVDLTNLEEFKRVSHYTNLRPLWWRDNVAKGNRIDSQEWSAPKVG